MGTRDSGDSAMKAAVIREHGGSEVVRVEEIEEPRPGPR